MASTPTNPAGNNELRQLPAEYRSTEALVDHPDKAETAEANSSKPTFGERSEQAFNPGTKVEMADDLAAKLSGDGMSHQAGSTEDQTSPQTREQSEALLDERVEQQARQHNPDQHQQDIHQPTTTDVLHTPASRPHTIDPMTGHLIYKGDTATLNGGTAAHEADD